MHTDCIVPYQFVHFHSAISKPTQFSTEKYYFSVTYSILERLGELALAPTIAHNELKSYNETPGSDLRALVSIFRTCNIR